MTGAEPGRRREAGVALVITLLVAVLLVAIVFEIFRAGSRAATTGAYGRDSIRASLLAEAGTAAAKAVLIQDARDNNRNDTLDEMWSRPAPPLELGDGTIAVTAEDEERKININTLVKAKGNAADDDRLAVFRRLLDIVGVEPSIADAVVDWMDADDTPRIGGAESSYYQSLPYPYRAKNDLFDTIEELRLVRGVTRDVFEKIRPFVTVHSSGRINVNTAPKEILMALSAWPPASGVAPIDEAEAQRIIEYRAQNPFTAVSADQLGKGSARLGEIRASSAPFGDLIDVKSTAFHVRSTGNIGGTVRTVDAVGIRSGTDVQWRFWRVE